MHLWTTQVTLIKQQVSSIKWVLFPWRPWYLLHGWMDGYGGISSLNVGLCAWCVPIVASSAASEAQGQRNTILPLHLSAWLMEIHASKGCTINPVSCVGVATVCCLCSRARWFSLQASSSLLISCHTLMTFVNLCSVCSPDRKRLFPIAAVDKKLSGGISRWPFPAQMMRSPQMDWWCHNRSSSTSKEKSMLSMLDREKGNMPIHLYVTWWIVSKFGSLKPTFKLQHNSVCNS